MIRTFTIFCLMLAMADIGHAQNDHDIFFSQRGQHSADNSGTQTLTVHLPDEQIGLDPFAFYHLSVECFRRPGPDFNTVFSFGRDFSTAIGRSTRVARAAHGVYISNDLLAAPRQPAEGQAFVDQISAENIDSFFGSTSIFSVIPIFDLNNTRVSTSGRSVNFIDSCERDFLIKGRDISTAYAYFLRTVSDKPGFFASALYLVQELIPPVLSLINGNQTRQEQAENLENTQAITNLFKDWLKQFEGTFLQTNPIRLYEGTTIIESPVSEVRIRIRPQDNGLLLGTGPFRAHYDDLLPAAGENATRFTLPAVGESNFLQECRDLQNHLETAGLLNASSLDVAFVLYMEAYNAGARNERIVPCLGQDYAESGQRINELRMRNGDSYLDRLVPETLRFSGLHVDQFFADLAAEEEAVKRRENEEKQWVILETELLRVGEQLELAGDTILRREGRIFPSDELDLMEILHQPITIRDQTFPYVMLDGEAQSDIVERTFSEFFGSLVEAGYSEFECPTLTRREVQFDRWSDGADAMLVALKSENGSLVREDAIVLRLVFDEEVHVESMRLTPRYTDSVIATPDCQLNFADETDDAADSGSS